MQVAGVTPVGCCSPPTSCRRTSATCWPLSSYGVTGCLGISTSSSQTLKSQTTSPSRLYSGWHRGHAWPAMPNSVPVIYSSIFVRFNNVKRIVLNPWLLCSYYLVKYGMNFTEIFMSWKGPIFAQGLWPLERRAVWSKCLIGQGGLKKLGAKVKR